MDNILFDIRGDRNHLKAALGYLKSFFINGASHYAIVPRKGLVLFWTNPGTDTLHFKDPAKEDEFCRIPVKVEVKTFDIDWEKFVEAWLQFAKLEDFDLDNWEKEPDDFDGSVGRGFRMNCDTWGHVGGSHCAFALIKPIAAWYGK